MANKTEIPQTENKDLWNLWQYANHSELEVLKKKTKRKEGTDGRKVIVWHIVEGRFPNGSP